jgi:predicted DNA-binding protein (MmcQ/YjbR family)
MAGELQHAADTLREFALGLPAAYEEFPWGERVIKVNKKIFVFFGLMEDLDKRLMVGVKLPHTGIYALQMPFVQPSGYNLGKHGWVTAQFPPGECVPLDLLMEWIEESYQTIAPRRLVAQLDQARAEAQAP